MASRIPSPDSSFASVSHADTSASFSASQEASMSINGDDSSRAEPQDERERHPKGRRKRTAAKDKAILEAAYNADPKPDKTARLEIVKRVSLNEKEVQIWFQNRRQNDRRRSRPLSPQEIAALRYGGMQILSSDGPVSSTPYGQPTAPTEAEAVPLPSPAHAASTTPIMSPDMGPWLPGRYPFSMEVPMPPVATPSHPSSSRGPDASRATFSFNNSGSFMNSWLPSSSFSTPVSFTRRGEPGSESFKRESFTPGSCPSAPSAPILPLPRPDSRAHSRPGSAVRLSLSLDGKASLISPSPERDRVSHHQIEPIPISIPSIRRTGLQRSHSVTLPPISALTSSLPGAEGSIPGPIAAPLPPRLTRGRSRDVHAWEFAADCGDDREDELTRQAKNEASGSAIAAISLLRSTSASAGSSTPVLQPNSGKRNASVRPPLGAGNGALMQPFKRARLNRAQSSVARLQTSSPSRFNEHAMDQIDGANVGKKRPLDDSDDILASKKMDLSAMVTISGNESDKENWSPEQKAAAATAAAAAAVRILPPLSFPPRRPLPGSSNSRRTGLFDGRALLAGARASTGPGGQRGVRRSGNIIDIFEDHDDDLRDDEVAGGRRTGRPGGGRREDEVDRFMRGEISPSKKGDFDCVTGLLSLSQGNWR